MRPPPVENRQFNSGKGCQPEIPADTFKATRVNRC